MRARIFRPLPSRMGVFVGIVGFLLTPHVAAAQYTGQVLIAPDPLPPSTPIDVFALNNSGQVFGDTLTGTVRAPVLWTGGVAQSLTIPNGYFWDGSAAEQFVNDSGTAVTKISSSSPLPGGVLNQVLRWQNGGAPDIVPSTPPSALSPPSCSSSYVQFYPAGLNNLGHVLILATDATGGCPWILWIWDGNGSSADHFKEITPVAGDATGCHAFVQRFETNHLNDQDHIAIMFGGPNPNCPTPEPMTAGILAGGIYTPLITLMHAGDCVFCNVTPGIGAFNNKDQLAAWVGDSNNPDLKFWDGTSVTDLGLARGQFMNDLGHIFFLAWLQPGPPVNRLYKTGVQTDVPFPTDIPGYVLAAGTPTPKGINTTGQLLAYMSFTVGGHPVPLPVLLSPTPPTIALQVNGTHPSPPVVMTSGPMTLTLDVSSSAYTAPVSWYWALILNGQVFWVTSTGVSTTAAPLAVAPPVAIAGATLLNVNLPPATTVETLFFFLNGSNSAIAGDLIVATRP